MSEETDDQRGTSNRGESGSYPLSADDEERSLASRHSYAFDQESVLSRLKYTKAMLAGAPLSQFSPGLYPRKDIFKKYPDWNEEEIDLPKQYSQDLARFSKWYWSTVHSLVREAAGGLLELRSTIIAKYAADAEVDDLGRMLRWWRLIAAREERSALEERGFRPAYYEADITSSLQEAGAPNVAALKKLVMDTHPIVGLLDRRVFWLPIDRLPTKNQDRRDGLRKLVREASDLLVQAADSMIAQVSDNVEDDNVEDVEWLYWEPVLQQAAVLMFSRWEDDRPIIKFEDRPMIDLCAEIAGQRIGWTSQQYFDLFSTCILIIIAVILAIGTGGLSNAALIAAWTALGIADVTTIFISAAIKQAETAHLQELIDLQELGMVTQAVDIGLTPDKEVVIGLATLAIFHLLAFGIGRGIKYYNQRTARLIAPFPAPEGAVSVTVRSSRAVGTAERALERSGKAITVKAIEPTRKRLREFLEMFRKGVWRGRAYEVAMGDLHPERIDLNSVVENFPLVDACDRSTGKLIQYTQGTAEANMSHMYQTLRITGKEATDFQVLAGLRQAGLDQAFPNMETVVKRVVFELPADEVVATRNKVVQDWLEFLFMEGGHMGAGADVLREHALKEMRRRGFSAWNRMPHMKQKAILEDIFDEIVRGVDIDMYVAPHTAKIESLMHEAARRSALIQ